MNDIQIIKETEEYKYIQKKLWNPKHFVVITFFFSIIMSLILYAKNYSRLKMKKELIKANILIMVMLGLPIIMSIFILNIIFGGIIYYSVSIGLAIYMRRKQVPLYTNHIDRKGKKASYFVPLIIGIVIMSGLFVLGMWTSEMPRKSIILYDDVLYYTDSVDEKSIEKLSQFFSECGIFVEDGNNVAVKLDYSANTYYIYITLNKDYIEDTETIEYMKILRQELSKLVYTNHNVKIIGTDRAFNPIKRYE